MFSNLKVLYEADRNGIKGDNFYITGAIDKQRPTECMKTPSVVSFMMIRKFTGFSKDDIIYEPCAGQGGILEAFAEEDKLQIVFNEKEKKLKLNLIEKFPSYKSTEGNNSLEPFTFKHNTASKVIMNPPFDNPSAFISYAINVWTTPEAEIVSLFPKYALARLNTYSGMYLSMIRCRKFTIEDMPEFQCGYGAKVSLIHIIK